MAEDGPGFGRGRGGRGRGRGKGKGRGKVSKLPTASDIAKRILEAEKFVIEDPSQEVPNEAGQSSIPQVNTPPITPATRNVNLMRRGNIHQPSSSHLNFHLKCKVMLQEDPLGGIIHHLSLFSLKEVNASA